MSAPLAVLVVRLVVATLLFAVAVAIRVRGPIGLVKDVDWRRVSDPQGLGQFTSLTLTLMSALIAAHGVTLYVFQADPASRTVATVTFSALIGLLALALLLGRRRYQDKDADNGR